MFKINNFTNNDDVKIIDQKGAFSVVEYQRDLSVNPENAVTAYFCSEMNVRKRQVVCKSVKHYSSGRSNAVDGRRCKGYNGN